MPLYVAYRTRDGFRNIKVYSAETFDAANEIRDDIKRTLDHRREEVSTVFGAENEEEAIRNAEIHF